ncbi:methyltransferase domain-containing protein [Sinorhizobium meliloti]|nr:methyltransferase domain-containing protein [Sinorhizobium meliloti]
MPTKIKYDLELFQRLNEEYRSKPLVPPNLTAKYDPETLAWRAKNRAKQLSTIFPLEGQRILEVGCGRGEVCRAMTEHFGATAVGVDVEHYDEWSIPAKNVQLHQVDLTQDNPPDLGLFDHACSFAVWEHVRHPFTLLKRVHAMLKPGGMFYLVANLYRGPQASHRYRQVFFPWPHLLFSDEVFEEFYESIGKPPVGAEWVNQLAIADYHRYFYLVGFAATQIRFDTTPIDEEFYQRFEDKLGRFPRYDLERDFMKAVLVKK